MRLLPWRGRPARLARLQPDPDRHPDAADHDGAGGSVRGRTHLGGWASHGLLHVRAAARGVSLRRGPGAAGYRSACDAPSWLKGAPCYASAPIRPTDLRESPATVTTIQRTPRR